MEHNSKKQTSPVQAMAENLIDDMYKVSTEITQEGIISVSSLVALSNTAYQLARCCANLRIRREKERLAK